MILVSNKLADKLNATLFLKKRCVARHFLLWFFSLPLFLSLSLSFPFQSLDSFELSPQFKSSLDHPKNLFKTWWVGRENRRLEKRGKNECDSERTGERDGDEEDDEWARVRGRRMRDQGMTVQTLTHDWCEKPPKRTISLCLSLSILSSSPIILSIWKYKPVRFSLTTLISEAVVSSVSGVQFMSARGREKRREKTGRERVNSWLTNS